MRLKELTTRTKKKYKIIVIDDDQGIIDTLRIIIDSNKYGMQGFKNHHDALKKMQDENFDIMILDFLLEEVTGRQVVEQVRAFNKEIYIILLTGYKDIAPPMQSLQEFDIQGYCEKGDRFDQLLLMIESAVKSINLTRKLINFHMGMDSLLHTVPRIYELKPISEVLIEIFTELIELTNCHHGFLLSTMNGDFSTNETVTFSKGQGDFNLRKSKLLNKIRKQFSSLVKKVHEQQRIVQEKEWLFIPLNNEFNDEFTIVGMECEVTEELLDIVKVFVNNAKSSYNNAILHAIVKEKNNELNNLLHELQENTKKQRSLEAELQQTQKMEVLGRMTGGIAHDFNNILTVILTYSQILLRKLTEDDPTYSQIVQINEAGHRARDLIRRLMIFSRKQNLEKQPLNLNHIITSLQEMVQKAIAPRLLLRIELDDTLWNSLLDKVQMEQVIMNLAVNAKDAVTEEGELTISTKNLTWEDVKLLGKAEIKPGDYIRLSVSDSGVGIDSEILNNIFEPFFTTKGHGQGTGLGLSTVYGIVKQTDGHIYVASELQKGTTFDIYLPKTDKKIMTGVVSLPKAALHGNETILVVDDQKDIKMCVSTILKEAGYSVLHTCDPEEAVTIYHSNKIDMVLTDIIMPKMNGRQLIQKLQKKNPQLIFLFMSGYFNNELLRQGLYFSRDNIIEKPFRADDLLSKVREVLEQKKTSVSQAQTVKCVEKE